MRRTAGQMDEEQRHMGSRGCVNMCSSVPATGKYPTLSNVSVSVADVSFFSFPFLFPFQNNVCSMNEST